MPRYQLDDGEDWVMHDRLNVVADGIVLKPPPAVLEEPDFFVTKKLPDRLFYKGYPLAEKRDDGATATEKRAADALASLLD